MSSSEPTTTSRPSSPMFVTPSNATATTIGNEVDRISHGRPVRGGAGSAGWSYDLVRLVVRLMQCPVCSRVMREPVTLPCGRSLCKTCLPVPHYRQNISWPATASRLRGFRCPLPSCAREHAVSDCGVDVTLNASLAVASAELERKRQSSLVDPDLGALVTTGDGGSYFAQGGRMLLATFALAQDGHLRYDADMVFPSVASVVTPHHEYSDQDLLATVQALVRPEMDCHICYAMFYEPVTTPCGHTFCRTCLQRVLDHAMLCPVCRRELTIQPVVHSQACPANQVITDITTVFWQDLLDARKQALVDEALHSGIDHHDTAIFVCTLSFPSMPTFLHIFEPRYRLMIRRALEGDQTFGMVLYSHNGTPLELGTILRIVSVEFFPDGRSLVETMGVSRFRMLGHSVLDGYIVAKTEKITDISLAEEEELEATEIRRAQSLGTRLEPPIFPLAVEDVDNISTSHLLVFAADFVRRMRARSVGWLTARILDVYGEVPLDPAVFPWWLASILPVRDMEKYRLLGTTSVRERMKICCTWILEWERNRW